MGGELLALGAMWYIIFLLSIVCHEGAHAWAAKMGGDDTAFEEGQVSLNPMPHIRREPFGTVVVPLLTYLSPPHAMMGWASAPFDPDWERRHPHRAAWMALAGPAANLALVFIAAALIHAGIAAGVFSEPDAIKISMIVKPASEGFPQTAGVFISILFSLNLLLCCFNLLPLPPLDGSSVIGLFMKEETALSYYEMVRSPTFSFIGILIAWSIAGRLFSPIFISAVSLLFGIRYM